MLTMASTTSILGGLSTMVPGDNNGAAKYKRKKSVGEWHEQRRTLAYSELAHLGVDNVMFALVSANCRAMMLPLWPICPVVGDR